jgi:hypothetical protein
MFETQKVNDDNNLNTKGVYRYFSFGTLPLLYHLTVKHFHLFPVRFLRQWLVQLKLL